MYQHARAMLHQQHSIDASRRRDMLQQEHLKCQQAIDGFAVELSCNSTIQSAATSGEIFTRR
ncbi:hypothetical protein COX84_04955 [Candidatus Micrarchaeota archaeon CG_4_10_14_0_2_um_filter_49_7]|nr:MAG: hypothetical protein COX84_04955 [Candidatus Micrarchaeota archaeon CG_4_10_14_0_2_um_filter_49_7]